MRIGQDMNQCRFTRLGPTDDKNINRIRLSFLVFAMILSKQSVLQRRIRPNLAYNSCQRSWMLLSPVHLQPSLCRNNSKVTEVIASSTYEIECNEAGA
jgi:hypothetical protein